MSTRRDLFNVPPVLGNKLQKRLATPVAPLRKQKKLNAKEWTFVKELVTADGMITMKEAAIRAGYLVGALERGAEDTGGIHAILLDRIRSAATNGLTGPAETHFEIGYQAGLRLG